ncbi:MAG: Spy/CpxP family protein refolding chaperone [Candidatus Obscuribacterales bacterium]|nr:Spy/CpxP family protein refolding chaperone [Candidatus Obscuribacterales bacterium]
MFGAGDSGPDGGPRFGAFFGAPGGFAGRHFLEGLELSDEQLEQIIDLKQKSFSKMAHARVDKMDLMQQIMRELGKPTIDRKKIAELKEKLKNQKALMIDSMIENMTEFAEILTAEQRKKVRLKKIRHFLQGIDKDPEGHEPGAAWGGPPAKPFRR